MRVLSLVGAPCTAHGGYPRACAAAAVVRAWEVAAPTFRCPTVVISPTFLPPSGLLSRHLPSPRLPPTPSPPRGTPMEGLTPEQAKVVSYPPSTPLAVVACAGAGKTRVLLARAVAVAAAAASASAAEAAAAPPAAGPLRPLPLPRPLLLLTFNRAAADELRERLGRLPTAAASTAPTPAWDGGGVGWGSSWGGALPPGGAPAADVHTFHALGWRILRSALPEELSRVCRRPRPTLLGSGAARLAAIADACVEAGLPPLRPHPGGDPRGLHWRRRARKYQTFIAVARGRDAEVWLASRVAEDAAAAADTAEVAAAVAAAAGVCGEELRKAVDVTATRAAAAADAASKERAVVESTVDDQLRRVLAAYEALKATENLLDFNDLVILAVQLLLLNPRLHAHWSSAYTHIMVDEFQDVCPHSILLVKLLTHSPGGELGGRPSPRPGLTVAMDDDQVIYEWRGASPKATTHFFTHLAGHPRAGVCGGGDDGGDGGAGFGRNGWVPSPLSPLPNTCLVVAQNHRSSGRIVAAGAAVIRHNTYRIPKEVWTANQPGQRVILAACRTYHDEASWWVSTVQSLVGGLGGVAGGGGDGGGGAPCDGGGGGRDNGEVGGGRGAGGSLGRGAVGGGQA